MYLFFSSQIIRFYIRQVRIVSYRKKQELVLCCISNGYVYKKIHMLNAS